MLVDELVQKITIKADTRALDVVQKKEKGLIATSQKLDGALRSAFKWIGGTLLVKSIFDASMEMDSLNRSFEALAGSSKLGAEEIRFLREEAERLGQSFPSIAQAYKGLFATGKGANMDNSIIRGAFTGVLEASAVLGTSAQETQSAIIALQQMLSKGKVMTQELRLQLGNALPGAFQIAAKAMGVTTAELEEMVSKGLDAKDFVQKFGDELHRQFGGKRLEGSIHSIRAEFTRLKNSIFDVKTGLFSGETGKAVSEMIKTLTDFIKSSFVKGFVKSIAVFLTIILKNIKIIASSIIIGKILKLITGMKSLGLALSLLSKSKGIPMMIKNMKLLSKAGWATIIPFAKLALIFVALHDLIVALFDEDIPNWMKRIVPTYAVGEYVAHQQQKRKKDGGSFWKDIFNATPFGVAANLGEMFFPNTSSGEMTVNVPQQMPNVTINQNIATGASPDDIGQRTSQALEQAFMSFNYGGVK